MTVADEAFVQPDPIVQAPLLNQRYHRYAYVFDSPLSFTDPSGFIANSHNPGGDTATNPIDEICVTGWHRCRT
jgi:hypothetical protein